ncbi:uncharacterized protein [Centruroides vittatus]|uniref:uncharacterized protein isoform X3 n=1 Tax=Centruroides vittatus TaxID=120091 RepID=UPI0035108350
MRFSGLFLIVFLSLYETTLCGRLYSSCSKSLADRYCDVKDKMSMIACLQKFEYKRGFEIFENCYNSISKTGKDETLEEKFYKSCSLNRDLCLYVQEMTENKNCGLYTNRPVLKFYDP